jgi:hypothetical protein
VIEAGGAPSWSTCVGNTARRCRLERAGVAVHGAVRAAGFSRTTSTSWSTRTCTSTTSARTRTATTTAGCRPSPGLHLYGRRVEAQAADGNDDAVAIRATPSSRSSPPGWPRPSARTPTSAAAWGWPHHRPHPGAASLWLDGGNERPRWATRSTTIQCSSWSWTSWAEDAGRPGDPAAPPGRAAERAPWCSGPTSTAPPTPSPPTGTVTAGASCLRPALDRGQVGHQACNNRVSLG